MAIKSRSITLTTGTDGPTGTATGELGLGAAFGRILKVEFKGDDANVDSNNTLAITDKDGRVIFAATALDAGTDDSTSKNTEQGFSTVGVGFYLTAAEAEVRDRGGDASADTEGLVAPPVARGPVTIDIAAGTDGDVQKVILLVDTGK